MNSEWIVGSKGPRSTSEHALLSTSQIRSLEAQALTPAGNSSLMEIAGLEIAKWVIAQVPHAETIWIACGRGNNGGDGMEAAIHLHGWGKNVKVSLLPGESQLAAESSKARDKLARAGISIQAEPPAFWDVCVDALLGIGLRCAPLDPYGRWIELMNHHHSPTLAVDTPSGLNADTGSTPGKWVRANATLTLLGLKPGLFTGQGRDACGDIWLNNLGINSTRESFASLNPPSELPFRQHSSHKGSFGDVGILGGAQGMEGAAVLAARAALHAGAGRVYLACLHGSELQALSIPKDIMRRQPEALAPMGLTLVAGCGGGEEISRFLPNWIRQAERLVLDADALNAIAREPDLAQMLPHRPPETTVLTPHPLEAARLLGCNTADVQADRIQAAQRLADVFQCTVILKGSGSIIAAPGKRPRVNPTGNALLAIGGTGDVLAGLTGTLLGQHRSAWDAASHACYLHGALADRWPTGKALTASRLLDSM